MRVIETPEDMHQLMRDATDLTNDYVDKCNREFGLHMKHFRVVFALKGTTAGKAFINKGLIQYNPTLLRENPEAFLARTVGHEVVHHAAYAKFGPRIDAHGLEWKAMMRKLGLPDTRCHTYDTSTVPTKLGTVANKERPSIRIEGGGLIKPFKMGNVTDFDD